MKNLIFCLIMFAELCINIMQVDAAQHIALAQADQKQKRDHKTNDLYKSYLEYSAYRNEVLSQNLANVNTPSYKADEVYIPNNFNELAGNNGASRKINIVKTSDMHISKHKNNESRLRKQKLKDPDEVKKNGNNVSLRQQMTKLSQNKMDYTTAIKSYATINSLFSSIIGK